MNIRDIVLSITVLGTTVCGCFAPRNDVKNKPLIETRVWNYVVEERRPVEVYFTCMEPVEVYFTCMETEDFSFPTLEIRNPGLGKEPIKIIKVGELYLTEPTEDGPKTEDVLGKAKALWNKYCPVVRCEEIMRERCRGK